MSALDLDGPEFDGKVAVVGMAVRVPGAGRDLQQFWRDIERGVESITVFDSEQLRSWGVPGELLDEPGFVAARAVIEDADCFDGALFGLAPAEAALTDPQQRILLECAWSAFEHAGYAPISADGNRTGVYVGTGLNIHLLDNVLPDADLMAVAGGLQVVIGNDKDFAATRIAYKLNLQGPCLSVQTACSTSLVAVHMAVQSLLTHETDMALAGGASLVPPSRRGYLYEPGGVFSADGHCRAFDVSAAGTVPGDGAGVVVLKRLSEAVRDGDTIHAVIAGSAVNNDGARKAGFTAPGVAGQAAVVAAALAVGGVDPDTVGVIETHGTGTPLGDPIEVAALREVFDSGSPDREPCALTALKSTLGHLDTAAGVLGLIKLVLALKNRTIPPVAHFTEPSAELRLDGSALYVAAEATPWKPIDGVRRAGISAFGVGGTNAHVVLEEAPPVAAGPPARSPQLLMLSARTEAALADVLRDVAAELEREPDRVADIAYTLRVGRTALPWRAAAVVEDAAEGARVLPLLSGRRATDGVGRVVFVFEDCATESGIRAAVAVAEDLISRESGRWPYSVATPGKRRRPVSRGRQP
jgi:acyl transferase domain-containing protein